MNMFMEHSRHMDEEFQQFRRQMEDKDRESSFRLTESEREMPDHVWIWTGQLHVARGEIAYLKTMTGFLLPSREPSPMPQAHVPHQQTWMSQEALRRLLNTADADLADTAMVTAMQARLPEKERAQAEQTIHTAPFRQWIVTPQSAKLLVQWGPKRATTIRGVSPLSVVGTSIAQALQSQPRFLFLSWFGGVQVDRVETGHIRKEHALVCSLIDQLLRQHEFDMRFLPALDHLSASLEDWLDILDMLIRQLPRTRTVCCVIDGVVLLERDEYAADALPVLGRLISIVEDGSVVVPLKLLLTSTPGTTIVRAEFEEEGLILNVGALPRSSVVPSQRRVIRELGQTTTEDEEGPRWD